MAYIDNVTNILQIQPDGLPTFVRLSQNENGRNLYFQLAGNEIDIPANATITISGTKPDGTVYSGTGSISDNVILIPEMIQMTAVAGYWDAKVKIISGGNTIATGRIRFVIDADTVDPDAVPSDSELEGLVAEAQQYAETARTEAYGSPLTAQTAAGMTDHTRVYVYTGSESGYTAGHWYFWDGSAWTDGGIYNSTAVNTDPTLTLEGVAADAKVVGDELDGLKEDLEQIIQHEPNSTADNAYSVGDYFIMDNTGALLVVTMAISVGDTIASGVNVSNVSFTSITNLLVSIINSSVNGNTELIKKFTNQIVRHEPDSVADHAYSVGEFFVYDVTNSLFKVKANISVGDSISTATNVTNIPYTSIVNYLYGLTEDLKTYTQNALEKTEDIRVLALDSYKIYENAKVTNGSKSYNETSITFTTLDTDKTINGTLFSSETTPIEVSDDPYTGDALVAEFDFTSTVNGVTLRVYGGSGVGTKTYNLKEGHNKIEFPKTHIQTVYFYRQHNTAVNTFTISNFILYQGSITENPFAFVNVPKRFNKIFTVGDSLTNITGNVGQGKNRWQDVVIEKCGFTGFVKEGGVGYTVATYAGQTSIWECVEALVVNNEVDFVTFWGGTNDWSRSVPIGDFDANLASPDTATFFGAYISCVRKLLSLYPDKRIILIGTTPRMLNSINGDWSTDGTINESGNTLMDFTNAVKTVAEYYGLPYLDLLHTSGINKINYATFLTQQQHSGDNFYYYLHFTEAGELRVGDTISGFINGVLGN